MIRFLAPLLGIVAGVHPLPLELSPEIAVVEVLLDGAIVGRVGRDEAPLSVDLGAGPRTHRIEAIAYRADGSEAGRVREWVNLPAIPEIATGPPRTPVPIVVAEGRLDSAALNGAIRADGRPVAPQAVSGGEARVVVVLDRTAESKLRETARQLEEALEKSRARARGDESLEGTLPALRLLGREGRVTVIWASAEEVAQSPAARYDLFATAPFVDPEEGEVGFSFLLARAAPPAIPDRIADAVCAAGWLAVSQSSARVVVLIVDPQSVDGSQFGAEAAREYLADLRVPLRIWSTAPETEALQRQWGRVEDVSSTELLAAAIGRLDEALESQRVVWLDGLWLPREISLAPGVIGLALAGTEGPSE